MMNERKEQELFKRSNFVLRIFYAFFSRSDSRLKVFLNFEMTKYFERDFVYSFNGQFAVT